MRASGQLSLSNGEEWFLRVAPWIVLVLLIAFLALNLETPNGASPEWIDSIRPSVLAALVTAAAIWFIACFTGSAEPRMKYVFVFAYAFTFGAFALLVTPFMGSNESPEGGVVAPTPGAATPAIAPAQERERINQGPLRPREGVLQLVRGCVRSQSGSASDAVSGVTRCPDLESTFDDPQIAGREVDRHYNWLVSVGGVTGRRYQPLFAKETDSNRRSARQYVEVHGGLAVPLFVVVLAFVGGAVSLSRRIPEYQRRSDPKYDPLPNEPRMAAHQARESVVFQIMQLVSAPFLALATWYIVSPTTIAAAAGLAFATGFLSEPLLLMIRGMVEGIRPAATRLSPAPGTAAETLKANTQYAETSNQPNDPDLDGHDDCCGHGIDVATPDEALPPTRGGVGQS